MRTHVLRFFFKFQIITGCVWKYLQSQLICLTLLSLPSSDNNALVQITVVQLLTIIEYCQYHCFYCRVKTIAFRTAVQLLKRAVHL